MMSSSRALILSILGLIVLVAALAYSWRGWPNGEVAQRAGRVDGQAPHRDPQGGVERGDRQGQVGDLPGERPQGGDGHPEGVSEEALVDGPSAEARLRER